MEQHSLESLDSQYALEIWKDIPGYEGIYQASTLGRFRSMVKRMRTRVGDILNGSQLAIGYCYIRLTDANGLKTRHSAHRLILHTFDPLQGWETLDVNHKNGKKGDNRVVNLEWMTRAENILHAIHLIKTFQANRAPKKVRVAKGRAKGEDIKNSKLTADDVREMRRLYDAGTKQKVIAQLFNVCGPTVSMIVRRKQWAHID